MPSLSACSSNVAGSVLAVFTAVSIAASISAMVLAGPRVYYAMARDGVFPGVVARVHTRFRTPGDRHRDAGRLELDPRAVGHARTDSSTTPGSP